MRKVLILELNSWSIFFCKTSLILKKLKNSPNRDIFIKTGSPEQYNDEFNTEDEIREVNECEGGIVVFNDMLDYNQKATDPFFTRGVTKI